MLLLLALLGLGLEFGLMLYRTRRIPTRKCVRRGQREYRILRTAQCTAARFLNLSILLIIPESSERIDPHTTGPVHSVVLTLTHGYNAVRGHRTGSNNSGAEDDLRRKTNKKQKIITQY